MLNVAWRFLSASSRERNRFRSNRSRSFHSRLSMIFSENRLPLFRIMLENQIAIAVGVQRPARRHHDGRAVFLDDGRAGDLLIERELRAAEQRHVDPVGRAPINFALAERRGLASRALD